MSYGNELNQHLSKVGATVADSIEYVAKQELMTGQQRHMNTLDPHPLLLEDSALFSTSLLAGIDATLAERGNRYGSFVTHAEITQGLKYTMQRSPQWEGLQADQKEALEMVAHKIGRILNGDPNYHDSWHDLVGYAKLVADRLASEGERK